MAVYEFSVAVRTQYLEEQSDPSQQQFAFAYVIQVANIGSIAARLISRHWIITDANGRVQEVRGLGVVGQQPLLRPGERFEYTSGATLDTAQGSMHGSYFCVAEDGERFEADIPEFALSVPHTLH